jgi:hypothetical protein
LVIPAVHHHPVTTTFAIFHYANSGESLTVCDPGRLEEETMQVFLFFSLVTSAGDP